MQKIRSLALAILCPHQWSRRMDRFLWWSGVVSWAACGSVGIFLGLDWAIDQIANSFNFKREFLAFVWERLKARGRRAAVGEPSK